MKKTIVFDFDGVIHKYSRGWQDGSIYDPPVEGISNVIFKLRAMGYEIVVVSTRCMTEEGKKAIEIWLNAFNIQVDKICKEKPPAIIYVDDRAICFKGDCEQLMREILEFKTWQQNKPGRLNID